MRGRAVYLIGLAFIATQIVNIFFMTITYGAWTIDHTISLAGIIGVALLVACLRLSHNFVVFATVYTLMLYAGIGMSAWKGRGKAQVATKRATLGSMNA